MEIKNEYKQTKIIPNDWKIVSIEEIADVKGGKRLPLGKSLLDAKTQHPYIRVTNMFMGGVSTNDIKYVPEDVFPSIKNYRIFKDDLFITVAGTLGIVGKIPDILDGANLTENADKITNIKCNREFLLYVLMSPTIQDEIESVKTAGAQPKLALLRIKKFSFLLPPLGEQKKIAEILSTWDKSIETTEKLIAAKQKLKKSLMQRLLTGSQRFPEFHGQEWKLRKFGEFLTESRISGSHGALAKKITVKLYGKGVFEKRERNQGSENTKYYKRKTGQFIYSKLDFLNGAFGLIPEKLNDFESTLDLPTFDISENLNSSWLLYYVSRDDFYSRFLGSAEGGRKARRVQPDEFLQIKLKFPPLKEQKKIAAVLGKCDAEINVLQSKLVALRQQKRGLMQKLLTGKVRVKIDENENAAFGN